MSVPLAAAEGAARHPEVSLHALFRCGFRKRTLDLALAAIDVLVEDHPVTLRGTFYRRVPAWFPSTDRRHYQTLGRILVTPRSRSVTEAA